MSVEDIAAEFWGTYGRNFFRWVLFVFGGGDLKCDVDCVHVET